MAIKKKDLVDESKLEEKILELEEKILVLEDKIAMVIKSMLRQDASIFDWQK